MVVLLTSLLTHPSLLTHFRRQVIESEAAHAAASRAESKAVLMTVIEQVRQTTPVHMRPSLILRDSLTARPPLLQDHDHGWGQGGLSTACLGRASVGLLPSHVAGGRERHIGFRVNVMIVTLLPEVVAGIVASTSASMKRVTQVRVRHDDEQGIVTTLPHNLSPSCQHPSLLLAYAVSVGP